jgi:ubiquinone/menaquinone biosynthesis C-methylase UbiE
MGFYSNFIIPFFYDYSMDSPKINEGRKSILSKINEEAIVEIGFGTGINLKFYPENVKKVIGIDVNEGMFKQFRKKSGYGRIELELMHQNGEALPFPEDSVSAILSTYTLCSVQNINSALNEVYRILKPGGKYYFLEHGLSDNPKTQKW